MRRILIVDDEHLVADTLSLIFEKNGFDVRAAYSTEEALQCARSFSPELLLCDLSMPERDGFDLISAMNSEQPGCSILVLTGAYASMHRVRKSAREIRRPLPVLIKPCHPAELLRRADELLLTA
jgi:DNA-binding response OmpR family regulator